MRSASGRLSDFFNDLILFKKIDHYNMLDQWCYGQANNKHTQHKVACTKEYPTIVLYVSSGWGYT